MTVSFRCPNCGKRLKADAARAGRSATCPRCASTVTVPATSDGTGAAGADSEANKPASDHGMLLVKPIPKKHEDLIDMTAMVDIVFFLLIFFMVTSMQALEAVIGLPTPQAQASAATSVAAITNDPNYVTVTIEEDDTVWIEDEQVFGAQDLRTRLRAMKKNEPLLTGMLVVGSPDASHGTFVMVLDAGADAGLSELMFSVRDQPAAIAAGG
jgi:biopolymer transport protein ExbD/DNA-directed RNA polymerase subunit RPC12/RpoP